MDPIPAYLLIARCAYRCVRAGDPDLTGRYFVVDAAGNILLLGRTGPVGLAASPNLHTRDPLARFERIANNLSDEDLQLMRRVADLWVGPPPSGTRYAPEWVLHHLGRRNTLREELTAVERYLALAEDSVSGA